MNLRNKIKESQMRLVELAMYLEVSRPTLYKYLELYESKEFNDIDKKCFDLFSFIDNTKGITRPVLMDYLINKIITIESVNGVDVETISNVRKLSTSQNETDIKKMRIINAISSTAKFDNLIDIWIDLLKSNKKITIEMLIEKLNKGEN